METVTSRTNKNSGALVNEPSRTATSEGQEVLTGGTSATPAGVVPAAHVAFTATAGATASPCHDDMVETVDVDTHAGHLPKPVTFSGRWLWPNVFSFVVVHAVALLALSPWFFSWTGVAVFVSGIYVFGTLGINLTYHRLLTHRGFTVPVWLERTFSIFGICSLQESPLRWVAVHRMHHQHSDHQPDPHTPLVNFFWSHFGWLIQCNEYLGTYPMFDKYAKDLMKDPFHRYMERGLKWVYIFFAHILVLVGGAFAINWLITQDLGSSFQLSSSVFVWGVAVRIVYVWHATWSVNSFTHIWGYRNYSTKDNSQNNWLVALLVNGEGWHNNHHAHPRCAAHGHRWWEWDVTYWTIVALEKVGLAKRVVHVPRPHAEA